MTADMPGSEAIRVDPLSPAVGLRVEGVSLLRIDSGTAAMILDLWQLGGALLFQQQALPEQAALNLAAVLTNGPTAQTEFTPAGGEIAGTHWQMPGAEQAIPHKALVFGLAAGLTSPPALIMAGMEAAADALRMEDPEFLASLSGLRCAHLLDGPQHPLVMHHPHSGEASLYPPPAGVAGAERLMDHAGQARFFWRYAWQPGDVLALDPRSVRCRWEEAPGAAITCIAVPGSAPLSPEHAGFSGLV